MEVWERRWGGVGGSRRAWRWCWQFTHLLVGRRGVTVGPSGAQKGLAVAHEVRDGSRVRVRVRVSVRVRVD